MVATAPPPSVAIIGCGAGGMFLCHALETYRRELLEKGDDASLESLPKVTCFERSSGPGGVWRAKRSFDEDHDEELTPEGASETTNMYEALWTNGAKNGIEFFDHTFDEHFGGPLPVYMPRQALLEYMMRRVTKNCPEFFEKYVRFNTNVVCVKYTGIQFQITTTNVRTLVQTTSYYDKCVWAAGENGIPMMPTSITSLFREGGFRGRMIHSSETSDFEADVKGKRILLIGGSYSAEDLALMAIKVGAERVYISSRGYENVVSWTSCWPGDKVEVLHSQMPVRVKNDCVSFAKSVWEFPNLYKPNEEITTEVRGIDTVVFCTGYLPNYSMLDPELRAIFDKPYENKLRVPSEWTMTANEWTECLGEVEPSEEGVYWHPSPSLYPDLYRGLFVVSNPSMIFLENENYGDPIFGIEGNAWLLMRYLTGARKIPSEEEMRRQNEEDCLRHLQNPYLRYYMDANYYDTYNRVGSGVISSESWSKYEREYSLSYYRIMARTLQEAEYPGVSFGTYDNLSETATTLSGYSYLSYYHRAKLDPKNEDEKGWRTFRDNTDADQFRSIFTGTPAVPLKRRWLDIDTGEEMKVVKSAWQPKVLEKTGFEVHSEDDPQSLTS